MGSFSCHSASPLTTVAKRSADFYFKRRAPVWRTARSIVHLLPAKIECYPALPMTTMGEIRHCMLREQSQSTCISTYVRLNYGGPLKFTHAQAVGTLLLKVPHAPPYSCSLPFANLVTHLTRRPH